MVETIKNQWGAKIALLLFLLITAWWIYTQFKPLDDINHEYFGNVYGILALWGAGWGLIIAKKWGGFRSLMGKALMFFSLGLFLQEFGQLTYSYYIHVLHVDIPYPSIGDIGFFGTIPFYIGGAMYLAKSAGVKVSLQSFASKIQAVIIPLVLLTVGYILFLKDYEFDLSNPLKIFLDFGYPLGQAIYISIGILTYTLTRNLLGGAMKNKVLFFIIAFAMQFLADYTFLFFQSSYYPGSFIDYMYVVSYFFMAMAILQTQTVFSKFMHQGDK